MKDKNDSQASVNPNTMFSTASSKDRLKDFDASKQNDWLKFSEAVIDELGRLFPSFPDNAPVVHKDFSCPEDLLSTQIGCTYVWLANKRREAAKLLKQGPFRHQFGLVNKAGFASRDEFNLSRDLPSQKKQLYEHVHALINKPRANIKVTKREQDGETRYTIYLKLNEEQAAQLHEKNQHSLFPFIENEVGLTITLHDYGLEDSRSTLIIDHGMTAFAANYSSKSSYFQVHFELLQPYFTACCNWSSAEGINTFLFNAGKIAHELARLQPVGRGNSAIVEWMIRGLAKAKSIELGPFTPDELGWDFKAFVTPDSELYAQWFSEKAFVAASLIERQAITLG